jgi:hypothetical protein
VRILSAREALACGRIRWFNLSNTRGRLGLALSEAVVVTLTAKGWDDRWQWEVDLGDGGTEEYGFETREEAEADVLDWLDENGIGVPDRS